MGRDNQSRFPAVFAAFNAALLAVLYFLQNRLHLNYCTTTIDQETEEKNRALETAERALQSQIDAESVRTRDLERQICELRDKLEAAGNARKLIEARLDQALRDQEKSTKELADRATQEQVGRLWRTSSKLSFFA